MNKHILYLFCIFLFGCGGGSSGNNVSNSIIESSTESSESSYSLSPTVDINAKYAGINTSADLTPSFVKEAASDLLFFEDLGLNLVSGFYYVRANDFYDTSETQSEFCDDGGTLTLVTSKTDVVGIADFIFDKCSIDGVVIDGGHTLYHSLTTGSLKAEFKGYSISNGSNAPILIDGTIKTSDEQSTITLNLLREYNDKQLLVKNLVLKDPYRGQSSDESPIYNGQLYYSDRGKIDLSLTVGYERYSSMPYYYFSNGAKLQIHDDLGNSASLQVVDENGYAPTSTNIYDDYDGNAIVEVNFTPKDKSPLFGKTTLGNLLVAPEVGVKPVAKESLSNNNPLSYPSYQSLVSIEDGIQFDGSNSLAPEGALLSYDWRILESPSGSEANLSAYNSVSPKLSIDYLGLYKIQMVVSDGVLESDPKIISVEVGSPSFNPLNVYNSSTIVATSEQVDGNFIDAPSFRVLTSREIIVTPNTKFDFLKFGISWSLINRPITSNSNLLTSDSSATRFVPDKAGSYTLEATINNGFTTIKDTKTVEVHDFEKAVTPRIYSHQGGSHIGYVDIPQSLEFQYKADVGSNKYSSSISLSESPPNSTPTAEVSSDQVDKNSRSIFSFTFDKPGRYVFEITATNGLYDIKPMVLVYNVLDPSYAALTEDTLGTELTPPDDYANVNSLLAGDINKDGHEDIVVIYTNGFGNKYQVLYGQSDNTFIHSLVQSAPSDVVLGLMDTDNNSTLELVFRDDDNSYGSGNSSTMIVVFFSEDDIDTYDTEFLYDGQVPTFFDSSYFIHSLSDINNDGLKDVILLKKVDVNNRHTHVGVAYSLQQRGQYFSSPNEVSLSNKYIEKVSHDETNNSLMVVTRDEDYSTSDDDFQSTVRADEFKFQSADLQLESSSIVNYSTTTPFGTGFSTNHVIDLDGDGVKEIIGSYLIAGYQGHLILKKNTLSNTFEISQNISLFFYSDQRILFADMDSDGDVDIVSLSGHVLYQDQNKQFNVVSKINRDILSDQSLLPYVYDIDNDGDMDLFRVFRIFFDDEVPNIKILRNTTN